MFDAQTIEGEEHRHVGDTLHNLGVLLARAGRPALAEERLHAALVVRQQRAERDPEALTDTLGELATLAEKKVSRRRDPGV